MDFDYSQDARDIFNPPVSTLDVIVYAVLGLLHLPREHFTNNGLHDLDSRAKRNAQVFLDHFGSRKIAAIREIRAVSGLGLKDAKEAFEQIVESYYGDSRWHLAAAKDAAERGDIGSVRYHLGLV